MSDQPPTLLDRLGKFLWLIGPLALVAWFGLLWFMFGDVL